MNCDLKKSDKVHKSGLPYWFCTRENCPGVCVSESGKCQTVCRSGQAIQIEAQAKKEIKESIPKTGCKPCEAARKVKERIRELIDAKKAKLTAEKMGDDSAT